MGEEVQTPQDQVADRALAGKLCSICQTGIIAGERVLACPYCALPFHAECWMENQGCSAYGCEAAPKTVKPAGEVEALSNAWGGEKPCPACGKSIKAQALKCRFCGASFETRDVIDQDTYSRREYDGREYAVARNKVVCLFLLSAAGCLAPLALIPVCMLIARQKCMGIDYKRLPMTLKAVLWSSIGVAGLMILIAVLVAVLD